MSRTSIRLWIWLPLVAAMVLLVALVARPLAIGWACYELHANAERAEARVVGADLTEGLVLEIVSGARAGEHCTADTSEAHRARLLAGDVLDVALPDARPDECVLVATLENSILFLWGLVGMFVAVLLLLVLIGLFVERGFARPATPATRFDLGPGGAACPRCGAPMCEGYLPLVAGLHWRELDEPVGLPTVVTGLPGTVGWRGRASVHAYRCASCEILTLRYGKPPAGSAS